MGRDTAFEPEHPKRQSCSFDINPLGWLTGSRSTTGAALQEKHMEFHCCVPGLTCSKDTSKEEAEPQRYKRSYLGMFGLSRKSILSFIFKRLHFMRDYSISAPTTVLGGKLINFLLVVSLISLNIYDHL